MLNTQSENSHECKLRTVTSWGCVTFILFCHLKKKKGTWREKKNERNEKTGGRGEGQDANTVVTVVDGCAAGQPNGLRWDTSAKEVRKKAGIFPGRLPLHVHAHTNAANTHADMNTHTHNLTSLVHSIGHVNSLSSYFLLCILPVLLSTPFFYHSFLVPPFLLFPRCLASSLFPLSFLSMSPTFSPPFFLSPHLCLAFPTSPSVPICGPSQNPDRHQGQRNIPGCRLDIAHIDVTALACKNI